MATPLPTVDGFGVKFQEAIDVLTSKLPEVSLSSSDLAGPVHAKVFTVAGSNTVGLVSDIQAALVSAKTNGTTITEFRKAFDATVQANGWTYKGKRGWRTRVIFDNNMRSAAMAGRWQQLQAGKARTPFLQYRTAGDARVRPLHRQWNGTIRHIDDPFWQTHYPPNGWGCRCTVRAYSQADLDRKGLKADTEPFVGKMRTVMNKDGEVVDVVPEGIDPGWDHNVGQSWVAPEVALGRKLQALPPALRDKVVEKSITPAFQQALGERWNAFQTAVKAGSMPAGAAQVVGFLDGALLTALEAARPVAAVSASSAVGVTADNASAMANQWPADKLGELPAQLRNYSAVLWDEQSGELVVVPVEGPSTPGNTPTIVLKPATTGDLATGWSIGAVGSQPDVALRDIGRYRTLLGRLRL